MLQLLRDTICIHDPISLCCTNPTVPWNQKMAASIAQTDLPSKQSIKYETATVKFWVRFREQRRLPWKRAVSFGHYCPCWWEEFERRVHYTWKMRYSGTPLQVTANSFQGKMCLRHSKSTILTAVSLNFYFFKYKVLFKGEWNLKTQAGMKTQIICKYFHLHASFGCSISISTKERLAHKLFHTFASHGPCEWCHWHRLLGTKWQHALSCFCGFQASICFNDFQALVLVKTGWVPNCYVFKKYETRMTVSITW